MTPDLRSRFTLILVIVRLDDGVYRLRLQM
jgi:hypothetical protein